MEDIIFDDPEVEKQFRQIIHEIQLKRNGQVKHSMKGEDLRYKTSSEVLEADLREIAAKYATSHLLALKLWNKNWRETKILASMFDDPGKVSEGQMDIWTKSCEDNEIVEHLVANLWYRTPFAYIKAIEWCRGKKHNVRVAGLLLMGRLAMVFKNEIDEMFEPFFDVLEPLAKDPALNTFFYSSFILLGKRSEHLSRIACDFARKLESGNSDNAKVMAKAILEDLGN